MARPDEEIDKLIAEARQMIGPVRTDLERAMSYQAIWARCSDKIDILDRMRGTLEGGAFDNLRDALHMSLVQTLNRLFDGDQRSASITNLLAICSQPGVADRLHSTRALPHIDVHDELKNARAVRRTDKFKQAYEGLKALRDKILAHTDYQHSKPSAALTGAKYGHERHLVEDAVAMVEHIDLSLNGLTNRYADRRKMYAECADKFWGHCAKP